MHWAVVVGCSSLHIATDDQRWTNFVTTYWIKMHKADKYWKHIVYIEKVLLEFYCITCETGKGLPISPMHWPMMIQPTETEASQANRKENESNLNLYNIVVMKLVNYSLYMLWTVSEQRSLSNKFKSDYD